MTSASGWLRSLNRRQLVGAGSLTVLGAALSSGHGLAREEVSTGPRFADMFRATPAELAIGSVPYISFLDVVASPGVPAHAGIAVEDGDILFGDSANWETFFGFGHEEILATFQVRQEREFFLLIDGTFDSASVQEVWRANGFAPVGSDPTLMTYNDVDGSLLDAHGDLGLVGIFGNYSCLGVIDDGRVAVAQHTEVIERAKALARGEGDHLGQADSLARVGSADVAGVDSAMVYPGKEFLNTGFATSPSLDADQRQDAMAFEEALRDAYGPTPDIRAVILGTVPVRDDVSSERVSVALVDPAVDGPEREAACERYLAMATARFEHHVSLLQRRPYTEFLSLLDGRIDDNGLVRMEFQALDHGELDVIDLQAGRDLSFLQYG